MKRSLAEYEIIHFSGHAANFEGKPSLVFPSQHGPTHIDAGTIGTWSLSNSRLITLAGCNTGTGPLAEGEAPWGLVPALMNAGAPAVITSLLPVDDDATQRLTSRFYELLATRSISKSRALQLAQLSILKESASEKSLTTLSWLPFVLIGDPR
jgi:CHAT domain-containing protein